MEDIRKSLDYSLSNESLSKDGSTDIKPIINSSVKLDIKPRDIRCMKGDCHRDCADCG